MKKIIFICGLLFLSIVVILNLVCTGVLDADEHVTLSINSFFYCIGLIVSTIFMFLVTRKICKHLYPSTSNNNSEKYKHFKKYFFIIAIAFYVVFTIVWTIIMNPNIVADQIHVCSLAQAMLRRKY